MGNNAKYIIVDIEIGAIPVAIVFDPLIKHSVIAGNFAHVTGAGFVTFDEDGTPYH